MKRHKITEEDIGYISEHINKIPTKEIARVIGVGEKTVRKVAHSLGIKLGSIRTEDDEWINEYIIKHYPNTSASQISRVVGRSVSTVGEIAKRLGISHTEEFLKRYDLTGQKFNRLLVLECGKFEGYNKTMCKCLCDCGKITFVARFDLIYGGTKSCGCLKRETTHGDTHKRIYKVYYSMLGRCCNPNNKYYHDYGGRGIEVCPEWRCSYESFRDWAYNNGYQEGLTIDRIDNNRGYCPENCRWVSYSVQSLNRRSNIKVTYLGKTQTVMEWASELNIKYGTLLYRVHHGTFPPKEDNQPTNNDNEHKS